MKLCECQVEVYTPDYNCDSNGGGRSWWLPFTVNSSQSLPCTHWYK